MTTSSRLHAMPGTPGSAALTTMNRWLTGLLLGLVVLLAACGGSEADIPGPSLPRLSAQPADQSVTAGSNAVFSVTASGAGPLSYQWWQSSAGGTTFTAIAGATAASYTVPAATPALSGSSYRVVVSNSLGSVTSSAATLTVTVVVVAPAITTQPADQTVTAPAGTAFNVTATGTSLSYQWQTSSDGGVSYAAVAGAADAPTLTLAGTTETQSGTRFRVQVSNSAGSVTSNAALLTVNPTPVAAMFTAQPASQTITAGQSVNFVVAAGGTPAPALQWRLNGGNLANEVLASGPCSGATVAGANSTTLTLTQVPLSCSGAIFSAVANNGVGAAATSNYATLTVNAAPQAPAITLQPVDQTVTAPGTATFAAAASGVPGPTVQWQHSTDGGATWANVTGATGTSYTTPATTALDNDKRLRAVFSNGSGSATSNSVTLTVTAVPVITLQPASVSVASGATATFTVAAAGAPAPSYQWQRQPPGGGGFSDIPGATGSSYTTPALAFCPTAYCGGSDDGAQVRVVATNAQGSVTSSATTLTVTPVALTGFVQVSAGAFHTLALRSDGTVWGWGHNGNGKIGCGASICMPGPVPGLSGTFTQVLATYDNSYLLRSDGTVWTLGFNSTGQLGQNLPENTATSTPGQVVRQSDGQPLTGIVGLTANHNGDDSVLAWTASGQGWAWGSAARDVGRPVGTPGARLAAVPDPYFDATTTERTLRRAAFGGTLFLAIIGDNTVVAWGQTGGGSTSVAGSGASFGFVGTPIDIAASGGNALILRSDNTLWGWAYFVNCCGIAYDTSNPMTQLAVGEGVQRIGLGLGGTVAYAIGLSGTVYAAGDNQQGQQGGGTVGSWRTTFAPVLTIGNALRVVSSSGGGESHTVVLRADGSLWGWGNNYYSPLGSTDSAGNKIGVPAWVNPEGVPHGLTGR